MLSFSQKLGHLPRTSASRYFWWLAFVDQPKFSVRISDHVSNTNVSASKTAFLAHFFVSKPVDESSCTFLGFRCTQIGIWHVNTNLNQKLLANALLRWFFALKCAPSCRETKMKIIANNPLLFYKMPSVRFHKRKINYIRILPQQS